MQSNEPLIIKLQSHWKGYLARKAYNERTTFIKEHLPAVIKIQVFLLTKLTVNRIVMIQAWESRTFLQDSTVAHYANLIKVIMIVLKTRLKLLADFISNYYSMQEVVFWSATVLRLPVKFMSPKKVICFDCRHLSGDLFKD